MQNKANTTSSPKFEEMKHLETRVDLDKRFPLSVFGIVVRSFWYLAALAVGFFSYFVFIFGPVDPEVDTQRFDTWAAEVFVHLLFVLALVCIAKLIYECLYYYLYTYKIELEHLTITKGVILRSRASAPIAKINDVQISRTVIQMMFGTYSIDLQTPSPVSNGLEIGNVGKRSALGIQELLLAMVETTLPDVKEAVAEKIIEEEIPAEEADRMIHSSDPYWVEKPKVPDLTRGN